MVQYDKSQALEVRRRVAEHLQQNGVFADLKKIVADVIGGVESDETLSAINQKELIQQIVGEQGGASPSPPTASDDCLLHLTMLGGRAFVDAIQDATKGPVRLCLHFGAQRFAGRPVAYCEEPAFADTFLLRLPLPPELPNAGAEGLSRDARRVQALLQLKQPVRTATPTRTRTLTLALTRTRTLTLALALPLTLSLTLTRTLEAGEGRAGAPPHASRGRRPAAPNRGGDIRGRRGGGMRASLAGRLRARLK